MELKIKVCGITDPVNAAEIASLKIDYAGYIFYQGSKRFVGSDPDEELFNCMPANINKTGVFSDEDHIIIIRSVEKYDLALVQLHGNESVNYCLLLKRAGIKIIKAFKVGSVSDFLPMNDYMNVCDYFLFDTGTGAAGGSGEKFNWSLIDGYHLPKPFFLAGGIGPDDASGIKELKSSGLYAIDLNSRFEISTGIKNTEVMGNFINELKSDIQ